jgi:hypothetical protein
LAHRTAQLSTEESAFVNDPAAFLDANVVIVRSPSSANRTGVRYWSLIAADTGAIHSYYLHFGLDIPVEASLSPVAADVEFFITATMNGCSFSFAQASPNAAAHIAHHNDHAGSGVTATIESQPIAHAATAQYFHQADYRKSRGLKNTIDGRYFATLVGKRDATQVRGRLFSKRVRSLRYRRTLVRYIDANPVQARLASCTWDCRFGSARAYVHGRIPPWLATSWTKAEATNPPEWEGSEEVRP